ncbi:hypothetical protein [Sanguibacter sp. 25GB23B1]|uniref:protein kinase family protein n=1 Tax=unclassified Sanguibacter TaxID=2645534 RepID=UPI0032AF2410
MDSVERGTLVVARYRLEDQIPSDLDGVRAWEAVDQILDRPVRVSLVDGDTAALTLDAARRAALVSDARLTRVLDVLHDASRNFVVTEPHLGRTLAELVETGPLSAAQARAVIGDAARALESARRRGVHHGALRPSAIRVHKGAVRVTGLGLDGALGTHAGAAPTGDEASRRDTVALVALLHYALTGTLPAAGLDVAALHPGAPVPAGLLGAGQPIPAPRDVVPDVPNDLDTLCVVTLGPNDDGPHTPGQLVQELEPWDEDDVPQNADDKVVPEIPGPPPAPGVQRQSVRATFGSSTLAGSSMPGTPPPAGPVRRPATGRIPRVGGSPVVRTSMAASAAAAAAAAQPTVDAPAVLPPSFTPTDAPPVAAQGSATGAETATVRSSSGLDTLAEPQPSATNQGAIDRTFESMVSTKDRAKHLRFNPTAFVLVLMLVVVIFGGLWAKNALGDGLVPPIVSFDARENDADAVPDGGTEPGAEPTDAPPPAAPVVVPVIASGAQLDPLGDNNEHPELQDAAIDGDSTTSWYTRSFNSSQFGGYKTGIGYAVTLAQPADVSTVFLTTNSIGGNVEVRATDPSTPTEGPVLASGPLAPETVLTLSAPVTTQTIVLWFTDLPAMPTGKYRVELFEIALS